MPCGETGCIDFHHATGDFAVEWLEPATGRVYSGDDLKGGMRSFELKAPFEGQAALYIYKK